MESLNFCFLSLNKYCGTTAQQHIKNIRGPNYICNESTIDNKIQILEINRVK
jgi:hypothetical protein